MDDARTAATYQGRARPLYRDLQLATFLVAIGSALGGPLRLPLGVPLVLAGLASAASAMWRVDADGPVGDAPSFRVVTGLSLMALMGLLAPAGLGPAWYAVMRRAYFASGLLVVLAWWRSPQRARVWLPALALVAGAAHVTAVRALTDPFIDSWGWTEACLRAIVEARHPYTIGPDEIAHASYWTGRTVPVYPYMPAALAAFLPAHMLFGDYRYLGALLFPATVMLVRTAGRRLVVDAHAIDVSSFVLLLFPRQFGVTTAGHIEPLMAFSLAAFACLVASKPGGLAQATAFLAIPALKQYCLVPTLLFLATTKRTSPATIAGAAALVGLLVLPFVLWNAPATLSGMVTQMIAPIEPRPDARSLVALLAAAGAGNASRWLSVIVQLSVGGIVFWRLRHAGVTGLLLGSAIALLATFLAGWQAFENYFSFIVTMLALTMLFAASPKECPL